jgi:membrane protein DedA with SNARE-associated domain
MESPPRPALSEAPASPAPYVEIGPPPLPPRLRRAAILYISVMSGIGMVGVALSPYLAVKHPLLLVAASADVRHVLLAAGRVDPWLLLPIATVRRILGMISTYAFGVLWGYSVLRWTARRSRRAAVMIGLLERFFHKVGLPILLFVPSYTLCMLAGAARLSWRRYLRVVIIGQIAFTSLLVAAGDSLASWTRVVVDFLATHLVESTVIAVSLVLVQQVISRRRRDLPAE